MANTERAAALFREGFDKILAGLQQLGYDVHDENFRDTARRAAAGFGEMTLCSDKVNSEISEMLERCFPAKYDEMVISKHNVSFGVCPHHLLPVIYRISVAYIPRGPVMAWEDKQTVSTLLSALDSAARAGRAVLLKVEPDIEDTPAARNQWTICHTGSAPVRSP